MVGVFNWSLRRALDTLPDSFARARLKIIFNILVFSLAKAGIVLGFAGAHEQWRQFGRAAVALVIYGFMVKLLLARPGLVKVVAHTMLALGVMLVWSNILWYSSSINLPTTQFVFMVILSSFYLLGGRWGITYSVVGVLPILIAVGTGMSVTDIVNVKAEELAAPGLAIFTALNFVTIVLTHFLFYRAFQQNIAERAALNTQLAASIVEAKKLAASKTTFLSTMSHELRTPLNSVIGMSELMIRNNKDKEQEENLRILHSSSLDLLALINNILDLNKTDADQLILEQVPFRLTELVKSKCSGLQARAKDKGLRFLVEVDEELERVVTVGDPTRLTQILYNLVSNAIKFTEQGIVVVKVQCLEKTNEQVEVLFSVTDTGEGISEDKHEQIFELFAQAESYTTRKHGGTGLGLAIVKQILLLFDSKIQLESRPGQGSRFHFTIKFLRSEEASVEEAVSESNEGGLTGLKVLVAEDNPMNRIILEKQLDQLNVRARMVEDGKQAFLAYIKESYDVVFLDLHMPVQDGYETIKQIRALTDPARAGVPVIAFTASITEQDKIVAAGFDDYLHKPASMGDLQEKLGKFANANF